MPAFQTLGELSSHIDSTGGGTLEFVDAGVPLIDIDTIDVRNVWKTQPSVRKVVGFMARAVALLPRKVYDRVDDTHRERVTDHPLARMMKLPDPTWGSTAFRFYESILIDYLLNDRWGAVILTRPDRYDLARIPARKFRLKSNALDQVTKFVTYIDGEMVEHDPAGRFLFDHGYAPSGANGVPPIVTLSDLINEQAEAVNFRRDMWRRGLKMSGTITRKGPWPNRSSRKRFERGLRQFVSNGSQSGGVLMLEDDMKFEGADLLKLSDTEDLKGRELTDIQVASAYHIAPEVVGAREGTFSNVKAFLDATYGPLGLGPVIEALDQVFNAAFCRDTSLYIETDVDAILRGNIEDQLAAFQTATGAPWMTRNEVRGLRNLPPIEGGDVLVVPLNVLEGGQASPRDSVPKSTEPAELVPPARVGTKDGHARLKTRAPETYTTKTEQVLNRFFGRQGAAVLSALGADEADWWDADRWDDELAGDLFALALATSTEVATSAATDAGFDADDYDVARTEAFLKSVAESRAKLINATTLEQVQTALDNDDEDDTPSAVFERAKNERTPSAAATLVTTFSAFAINELGRQMAPETATKTWLTTSKNPRSSHAAMNGQTVGIDETFSNGLEWPGDPSRGADEVAGCMCELEIAFQ